MEKQKNDFLGNLIMLKSVLRNIFIALFFFFFFPLLSVSKHQQVHNLYNLVDQMKIKHACTYKTIIPQQKETYACVLTISLNRANRGSVFVELLSNQHFERLLSIIETLEK